MGKVVRRRGSKGTDTYQFKLENDDFEVEVPQGCRKKAKRRPPLAIYEKTEIVHEVLVELDKQKDVARKHRISDGVVSRLVCKAQRSKNFLQELVNLAEKTQEDRKKI